jgi:hypothetical protein
VQGSSCDSSTRCRPHTAAAAAAAGRAGTAADVYCQQPDHSSSATGAALSGLLSSLFTGGAGLCVCVGWVGWGWDTEPACL